MHRLLIILVALVPYIDDVYFWEDSKDAAPIDYTVLQGAKTDTIAHEQSKEKIEIINAQDTTVTVVVHRK